jgi:hypothetical protein
MRRAAITVLSTALLLAASSSDDPTVETSPSATETPSETDTTEATETESDLPLPTETTTTEPDETEAGSEPGAEADLVLTAELTGVAEVPGPGDPAGSGSFQATIVLNEAAGELCYQLEVADLSSEVSAAHIHAGAEGEAGDVHVPLTAPIGGPVDECVPVNATELQPMMDDPAQFYVNVHTQGHPDGAVRGQLQAQ